MEQFQEYFLVIYILIMDWLIAYFHCCVKLSLSYNYQFAKNVCADPPGNFEETSWFDWNYIYHGGWSVATFISLLCYILSFVHVCISNCSGNFCLSQTRFWYAWLVRMSICMQIMWMQCSGLKTLTCLRWLWTSSVLQ